ncbi:MAG: hypothetical protein OXC31_05775 [Spirochaetaceae bacterium]|nr:hypothetical protein [Spirochaetaceae bacterium]
MLVGNTGYRGIRSIVNADGPVRVSTANMNCVRIRAEFPANPRLS